MIINRNEWYLLINYRHW